MTVAYITIADSEIDPESPGTTSLFTKLRNNPIAIAEDDPTAPNIVGASLVLIETKTASASSELAFITSIDSTYSHYIFKLTGVLPATNTAELFIQASTNLGSSYLSTAEYEFKLEEKFLDGTADSTTTATATSRVKLALNNSNVTSRGVSGELLLFGPGSSVLVKSITSDVRTYDVTAGAYKRAQSLSVVTVTTALNGIRFYFSSGNIASGSISLYGVKI